MIDLRSDTVTNPSKKMLDFMFQAKLGDDVFEEDPTVNELQNYAAALFGKEDALYCSSGTQTNQIAINLHVNPGGEVICHKDSHVFKYEGGGIAKNSGASTRTVDGDRGRITLEELEKWINPENDIHYPLTQLVSIEDTANRGGGALYDFKEILRIRAFCNKMRLPLHLDGARVFNALTENQIDYKEYGKQFDSISICLSKGLGAPVGSLLLGDKDFIHRARRVRKVFGGGMRQAGIIAAGGLFALKNNVKRLSIDHEHAKQLEKALNASSIIKNVIPVETNIVVFELNDHIRANEYIQSLEKQGILALTFGKGMIRLVTHLDLDETAINKTCECIQSIV
ncbi:aminotransferase class I/II-fold pyridoxal phosphate-dependent enzyme [Crocinitomicaceae bacterium]|nr:aminotransferase class I/II-fold pyridoxal phosphate-dependent enzyme [Crocinitomicaceae bacterium]